mgnify:CR=1 FL=1
MSDWTAGYVADIGYTYGYYTELNPLRVRLAFLNAGLVPPEVGSACELGFGQGMSANLHAAASVVQWAGTDFNPAQAGFAQEIANVSGANARLFDEAFAEFCAANRVEMLPPRDPDAPQGGGSLFDIDDEVGVGELPAIVVQCRIVQMVPVPVADIIECRKGGQGLVDVLLSVVFEPGFGLGCVNRILRRHQFLIPLCL